jgi:Ca-activated chloride channel family protein
MSYRSFGAAAVALAAFVASPAHANPQITLDARLAQPVMKDGARHKNYLRVALKGCEPQPRETRTPVNVAFVIDRSGSMSGERIVQAREAAIMAVRRLQPDDIAALVVFDTRADVLIPAQKVADPGLFIDRISRIGLGGSTAIHDGVDKGRAEVLANFDAKRLNRIVLLSDGQANVGPSRPEHFAQLGRALLAQGISVSTIGLGLDYNEDLMLQLALASDGNHAFARDPSDLIQIFNREFNDVLAACAQTVSIDIELRPGVKAVKALSRDATIEGGRAQFRLNQVYAATEHYVLLEVELDKGLAVAGEQDLGIVKVAYTEAQSGAQVRLDAGVRARFTASEAEASASADPKVGEAVVEQAARWRAREAVRLRDSGRLEEARALLMQNATEINAYMSGLSGPPPAHLVDLSGQYRELAAPTMMMLSPAAASQQRKALRQLENSGAGRATRY